MKKFTSLTGDRRVDSRHCGPIDQQGSPFRFLSFEGNEEKSMFMPSIGWGSKCTALKDTRFTNWIEFILTFFFGRFIFIDAIKPTFQTMAIFNRKRID